MPEGSASETFVGAFVCILGTFGKDYIIAANTYFRLQTEK